MYTKEQMLNCFADLAIIFLHELSGNPTQLFLIVNFIQRNQLH